MKKLDFKAFILEGKFFGISRFTKESEMFEILGEPLEIEEYGESGKFLHYGEFRIAVSEGKFEYVDCFFMNSQLAYEISISEKKFLITKTSSVLELLYLFNLSKIKWQILCEHSNLDYLKIEVANGILIVFYYENSALERISLFPD